MVTGFGGNTLIAYSEDGLFFDFWKKGIYLYGTIHCRTSCLRGFLGYTSGADTRKGW